MFSNFRKHHNIITSLHYWLSQEIDNQCYSYHNSDKKDPLDCFQVVNVSAQETLGLQSLSGVQVWETGHQPCVPRGTGELCACRRLAPHRANRAIPAGKRTRWTAPDQSGSESREKVRPAWVSFALSNEVFSCQTYLSCRTVFSAVRNETSSRRILPCLS